MKKKWEVEFDDYAEHLEDEFFVLPDLKKFIEKLINSEEARKKALESHYNDQSKEEEPTFDELKEMQELLKEADHKALKKQISKNERYERKKQRKDANKAN